MITVTTITTTINLVSTEGSSQERTYLREPAAIYARSFALIDAELDLTAVPKALQPVVRRVVHSCGMTDILAELRWRGPVAEDAQAALTGGAPVIVDASMVSAGVQANRLPAQNRILCLIDEAETAQLAKARETTRSAAAIERLADEMGGAVVVIGNAPTALFRLLELLKDGAPPPSALFAFPVGFVGAAESKQALVDAPSPPNYLTLLGRRGGSAMAAAAVNALLPDLGSPR
ncbi:MAG: precorrin-8X methylmutase [Geminicoccaceae bacterium]